MLCSSPFLLKIKYYHLRLNKAKYLALSKTYASPTFMGLLFNISNSIVWSVQLQMVTLDFKEEGTGTEYVAIATSKCVASGILHRVQNP